MWIDTHWSKQVLIETFHNSLKELESIKILIEIEHKLLDTDWYLDSFDEITL